MAAGGREATPAGAWSPRFPEHRRVSHSARLLQPGLWAPLFLQGLGEGAGLSPPRFKVTPSQHTDADRRCAHDIYAHSGKRETGPLGSECPWPFSLSCDEGRSKLESRLTGAHFQNYVGSGEQQRRGAGGPPSELGCQGLRGGERDGWAVPEKGAHRPTGRRGALGKEMGEDGYWERCLSGW